MASVLEQAGVRQARAVIITTSDDLTNLDAAITARDLNLDAKIVIRLFDETLASKVAGAFAMPTISTSQVAAPAFIAAATGRKIYQGFQLAGQQVHLTDITICPTGRLVGRTVGDIQADKRINIVMHQGPGGVNVNPDAQILLEPGDIILVIAPAGVLADARIYESGSGMPGAVSCGRQPPGQSTARRRFSRQRADRPLGGASSLLDASEVALPRSLARVYCRGWDGTPSERVDGSHRPPGFPSAGPPTSPDLVSGSRRLRSFG